MKTTYLPYIFACLLGVSALQAQAITNFVPRNGKEGTEITITGTGFSGNVEVAFGTSAFVSATGSATEITANVPSDASAGKVKVKVGGAEVQSTDDFNYVSIENFTPNPVEPGRTIIFTGTGFPNEGAGLHAALGKLQAFVVTFKGCSDRQKAESISDDRTTATVRTCHKVKDGEIGVEMRYNTSPPTLTSHRINFKFDLDVDRPDLVVLSFSPTSARVGETITINGSGFSDEIEDIRVDFKNHKNRKPLSATTTVLTVAVPPNAEDGPIEVRIPSIDDATTSTSFMRLNHTVDDFNPKEIFNGQELTITGTNFAAGNSNQVCFIDVNDPDEEKCSRADVNNNGTQLTLNMPSGAPRSGTIEVRVGNVKRLLNGTYTLRDQEAFTFTGFEPKEVRIGQIMTITGTGFDPNLARNFVWLTESSRNPQRAHRSNVISVNEDLTELKVVVHPNINRRSQHATHVAVGIGRDEDAAWLNLVRESGLSTNIIPLSITDFDPKTVNRGRTVTIEGTGFSLYAEDNLINASHSPGTGAQAHYVNEEGTALKVRMPLLANSIVGTLSRLGTKNLYVYPMER